MKKRIIPFVLAAAMLFSLGACAGKSSGSSGAEFRVYRLVKEDYQQKLGLVSYETMTLSSDADPVQSAAYALASAPTDDKLSCAIPTGVSIEKAVQSGSVAEVYLNSAYSSLTGMDKTVADYCITLTMCTLPGIEYVSLYVGEKLAADHLTAGDAVLTNTVDSSSQVGVRVFFPLADSSGLAYEYRTIDVTSDDVPERLVMDELLSGPKDSALKSAFPAGTVLLSVYTNSGVCSVSFASGFLSDESLTPEDIRLSLLALVKTLTSLSEVSSVQILIDGSQTDSLGGYDISAPLTANSEVLGSSAAD